MSVIEKSVQLGKDLFAINRKTTRELVAIQIGGVRRYVETNVSALRGVGAIKSFPELAQASKTYNSTLIAGVQSDVLAGRDVVKGAFEDTRAVLSSVANKPQKPARKPAARKTTARKASATKTTARKTAARKPAAKKAA